jgi:hypothetical protein
MPKNPPQDKKTVREKRNTHAARQSLNRIKKAPQSVEMIMKNQGWLQNLQRARGAQQAWLEWIAQALPEELRGSLVNVVRKGNELTVLAASAAWSSRMRYALAAIEPAIRARAPDIVKVTVRVSPAGR